MVEDISFDYVGIADVDFERSIQQVSTWMMVVANSLIFFLCWSILFIFYFFYFFIYLFFFNAQYASVNQLVYVLTNQLIEKLSKSQFWNAGVK